MMWSSKPRNDEWRQVDADDTNDVKNRKKKNLNVWICASKGEKTVAAKCGTLLDTQTQPQPAQSEKKSLHQKW